MTQMYKLITVLLGIILWTTTEAAPEEFTIDPAHTFAVFEVGHLGISTQRGRFNRTTGRANFDSEAGIGSVEILIDSRSIDTGNEPMEKLLRGEYFFNVDNFPQIVFRSTSVSFTERKPDKIDGQLSFLGTTKPVTVTVLSYNCTRLPFLIRFTCGMDAVATIKRSDFGMTSVLSFVSDEVKILIQAEAIRKEPPPSSTD